DVDHRTDLWSMGAILFESIAGAPPFTETSYARLVMSICQRDPPRLEELSPGVPPTVARTIRRALERDRARRFQSAEEFLAALVDAMPDMERARVSAPSLVGIEAPMSSDPAPRPPSGDDPSRPAQGSDPGSPSKSPALPGAELRTYTAGAATLWLSQAPTFSVWRGEVAAPDRLRIEARDGNL